MNSRRTFLKASSSAFLSSALFSTHSDLLRSAPLEMADNQPVINNFLQEYYLKKLSHNAYKRSLERQNILTVDDVFRLKEDVRNKAQLCYGSLPERTPLNIKITGELKRSSYTIQNLIYESRPGYPVTANLYLPHDGPQKKPAVLCTCGHSANGKAYTLYQEFARHLARMGYISLIYDPPGQGERIEYHNHPDQRKIRSGTYVHNHLGNLMTLNGDNFAAWETWDGIRGIDYLLSRSDVDPKRVGVTGNSGGGTQTSHLNCLDDRISFSAPSCFVTKFIYNLQNELPTDAEQVIPGWIAQGLDMADFFITQIPRPVILIGQQQDFFDFRGLKATYQELKRLYTILGKPDNIQLHMGPGRHGFHKDGREAMYKFFNAFSGISASPIEPTEQPEKDKDLYAAPEGQILNLKPKTTHDFIAEKSERICKERKSKRKPNNLAQVIQKVLVIPDSEFKGIVPGYSTIQLDTPIESDRKGRAKTIASYLVSNDPPSKYLLRQHSLEDAQGREVPDGEDAYLHVSHLSSDEDLSSGIVTDQFPEETKSLFTLDVRGSGPLYLKIAGDRGNDFLQYYGGDFMYANHGFLLNVPLAGRRVLDVLSSFQWLRSRGYKKIALSGRGIGALYAQLAAAIDSSLTSLTLVDNVISFESLTENPRYQWPFSAMIPDVLNHFDLPELRDDLSRKLDLKIMSNLTSDQLHIK